MDLFLLVIQLLVLVYRFGGQIHAKFFKGFDIHIGEHDGGVYLAA